MRDALPVLMIRRVGPLLLGGLLVVLSLGAGEAGAQQAPDDAPGTVLARFGDARALAVDPRGRLYVADAGEDVVVLMGKRGTRRAVIGGSGTRAGEFDMPSDVDPTNGQVLLVADTYNGRVQRFSEEGQYLESIPIGPGNHAGVAGRVFDDGRDGAAAQGEGRPIAVASTNEGAVFVLDERGGRLYKWSSLRPLEVLVGGFSGGEGRLEEPVDLALGPSDRLYVADSAQEAVLVYDAFGTFVRRLPTSPLPNVRAVTVHQGRLWIACTDRIAIWDPSTRAMTRRTVALTEPLEDIALYDDVLYMLTATRLIRRSK